MKWTGATTSVSPMKKTWTGSTTFFSSIIIFIFVASERSSKNDPAAGSPTATLLRLLPLLDCEYRSILTTDFTKDQSVVSKGLYSQPITGNDGRCVQEPGTYSVRSDETRLQDIPRSWRIISSINPHHDFGSKFPQPLRARLQSKSSLSKSVYCACSPAHLGASQTCFGLSFQCVFRPHNPNK